MLLIQLHLVVDILFAFVFFLVILILLTIFILNAFFDLAILFLILVLSFHLVFLINLAFGALHLNFVDDFHLLTVFSNCHIGTTLLHEGLASVLGREVRRGDVKSIVVLGGDKELTLLISEMLIRVVACFS